jgi:hypothetical protein
MYRRPRTQHAQYNHHWYIDFAAISQVETQSPTTLFAPFFWHALQHGNIIVHFFPPNERDKTFNISEMPAAVGVQASSDCVCSNCVSVAKEGKILQPFANKRDTKLT